MHLDEKRPRQDDAEVILDDTVQSSGRQGADIRTGESPLGSERLSSSSSVLSSRRDASQDADLLCT